MFKHYFMHVLILSTCITTSLLPTLTEARERAYKIVERPQRVCRSEVVDDQRRDYTGALIGGVAGGLLGSQIGNGRGNTAATVVGAGTGAVMGDHINRKRNQRVVQHCHTVMKKVRVPIHSHRD